MDHLAPKSNALYSPHPVPFLYDPANLSVRCDRRNFSSFPSHLGWYLDGFDPTVPTWLGIWKRKPDALPDPSRPSSLPELVQVWLFFGMLNVFFKACDIEVQTSDFIRVLDDGSQCISTTYLGDYLEQWASQARALPGDRALELKQVLHIIFTTAVDSVDKVVGCDRHIVLSMFVLAETLENAARYALPALAREPLIFKGKALFISGTQKRNWCRSEKGMFGWAFDASTRVYVLQSLLPRPASLDHSNCSLNHCLARQIDDTVYQTKHVFEDCTCPHVQLDLDLVKVCLKQNHIPCLRVIDDGDHLRLTVAPGQVFAAISHVWSDGLGNAKANSLPQCQLRRLQSLSNALFEHEGEKAPAHFWIDTLCVPLDEKYRKLALRQLGDVYAMADWVLVLDSGINKMRKGWPIEDKLISICFSGWLRRLWTLQEGLLCGERLRFQLQDGIFRLPQSAECLYSTVQSRALQFIRQRLPPLRDAVEIPCQELNTGDASLSTSTSAAVSQSPHPPSNQQAFRNGLFTGSRMISQAQDVIRPLLQLVKYLYRTSLSKVVQFIRMHLLPFCNTVGHYREADRDLENANARPSSPPATTKSRRPYARLRTDLFSLFPALLYRSTSKKTDETICLSSMLGIPPADLLSLKTPEQRMQQFWNILVTQASGRYAVPADVLFTLEPKLDADSYRWAPKSLMDLSTTDLNSFGVQEWAYFDGRGLRTSSRGYRIRRGSRKLSDTNNLWFHPPGTDTGRIFKVTVRVVSSEPEEEQWSNGTRGSKQRLLDSLNRGEEETCIILSARVSGPDRDRDGTFVQLVRGVEEGAGSSGDVQASRIIVARAMEQIILSETSIEGFVGTKGESELEVSPIDEDEEWYIF